MAHTIAQTRPKATAVPRAQKANRTKLALRQQRLAWLMILPTLLALALVAFYPLLRTFYNGFTDARLASAKPVHFIGLQNYRDLLQDTDFLRSIWVTVRFTVITVVLEFVLG